MDKGLDNIKAELEKKGYLVEFADDITGDIAAYIYKDSFTQYQGKRGILGKQIKTSRHHNQMSYLLGRRTRILTR